MLQSAVYVGYAAQVVTMTIGTDGLTAAQVTMELRHTIER